MYETVRYHPDTSGLDSEKVCDAANNSNCGLMEYYDRRKNCIQIFVKDESSSPGMLFLKLGIVRHGPWIDEPKL